MRGAAGERAFYNFENGMCMQRGDMVGRYDGRTGGRVWNVWSWLVSLRWGCGKHEMDGVWGYGVGHMVDGDGYGEGLLECWLDGCGNSCEDCWLDN